MAVLKNATTASVLVLNPGSATLKWGVYEAADLAGGGDPIPRASSLIERPQSLADAAEAVLRESAVREPPVWAVGCRVVHGGAHFVEATPVSPAVVAEIRALAPLAPLHNPAAANVLETCLRLVPRVPVVAVFDTAFHATLPPVARTYALPRALCEQHGLRRYGFHGIAHRQVSETLRARLVALGQPASRLVTCHLGSGASVCAIKGGQSVDTSMGLTPLEGLVMGTRSGDVDPGLLLYLLNETGMTPSALDDLLNHRSGLLGVSGRSGDLRDLERAARDGDVAAELALDLFAYRTAKTIGAYAIALEGLDAIAFSGGIGEHSATMRERICRRLAFLGLDLDIERNARATDGRKPACICRDRSRVAAWVVPADENAQIARETWTLLPGVGP